MNTGLGLILPEGRHDFEQDAGGDFVWTRRQFIIAHDAAPDGLCRLTFHNPLEGNTLTYAGADGREAALPLAQGLQSLSVPFISGRARLTVGQTFVPGGGDQRHLGLQLRALACSPRTKDVQYLLGFREAEADALRPFRWMGDVAYFDIQHAEPGDWIMFEAGHNGVSPTVLSISAANTVQASIFCGWQQLAFPLAELGCQGGLCSLACDYRHEAVGDLRRLSLMIGDIRIGRPTAYERNSAAFHADFLRQEESAAYPLLVAVDTNSSCNMRCNMCILDQGLKLLPPTKPGGFATVRPAYDELLPYAAKLQLHVTGDPLRGPGLWEALDMARPYAQQRPLEIEFSTNGQLLTPDVADRLLDSPLAELNISVDAATERTYRRLRGGDFQNVLGNIRHMQARAHGTPLRISMSMVLMRETIEELPAFIELAAELGVGVVTFTPLLALGHSMPRKTAADGFVFSYRQQLLLYYPRLAADCLQQARETAARTGVWLGATPAARKDFQAFPHPDLDYPLDADEFERRVAADPVLAARELGRPDDGFRTCNAPWSCAFITQSGHLAPCLFLMYRGWRNPTEAGLAAAWNSPQLRALRRDIRNGREPACCVEARCPLVRRTF